MESADRKLSRKDMLKLGLLGSATIFLPFERTARTRAKLADRIPESALPRPFTVPFAVPRVARPVRRTRTTDYYRITMKRSFLQMLPGRPKTEVWAYNGLAPGPTIVAQRGRNVVCRQINRIPGRRLSVHLHGNASLPHHDGYASDLVRTGFYKDYHWPNRQDARTLWYHDHGEHHTAENAYMGLAGLYITHDKLERSLPIPKGRYDVPLVLRDAIFARNGQMIFDDEGHNSLFGDVILANGRPWPVMKVERRKYRFRILNASVSRSFNLALSSGEPMTVIGTDGGLMPHPVQTTSFRVGMAERYEVVIDFSRYRVGQQVVLRNLGLPSNVEFANTDVVMRFDVAAEPTDRSNNSIPEVLNPNNHVMKLDKSRARTRRRFEFDRHSSKWTINRQTWGDVIRSGFRKVVANPGLGDVEIWQFKSNAGGWFHPVHVHLIDFRIISRNGGPCLPYERGPKDTAYVGEGETVEVIAKFGPHRGRYMLHCHNLVHEDHDMMVQFQVGTGGPHPVRAARARPLRLARRL